MPQLARLTVMAPRQRLHSHNTLNHKEPSHCMPPDLIVHNVFPKSILTCSLSGPVVVLLRRGEVVLQIISEQSKIQWHRLVIRVTFPDSGKKTKTGTLGTLIKSHIRGLFSHGPLRTGSPPDIWGGTSAGWR